DAARLARFECKGESNRLGPLALEGNWRRDRGHIDLSLDLTGIPFNPDLLREAARFAPLRWTRSAIVPASHGFISTPSGGLKIPSHGGPNGGSGSAEDGWACASCPSILMLWKLTPASAMGD